MRGKEILLLQFKQTRGKHALLVPHNGARAANVTNGPTTSC